MDGPTEGEGPDSGSVSWQKRQLVQERHLRNPFPVRLGAPQEVATRVPFGRRLVRPDDRLKWSTTNPVDLGLLRTSSPQPSSRSDRATHFHMDAPMAGPGRLGRQILDPVAAPPADPVAHPAARAPQPSVSDSASHLGDRWPLRGAIPLPGEQRIGLLNWQRTRSHCRGQSPDLPILAYVVRPCRGRCPRRRRPNKRSGISANQNHFSARRAPRPRRATATTVSTANTCPNPAPGWGPRRRPGRGGGSFLQPARHGQLCGGLAQASWVPALLGIAVLAGRMFSPGLGGPVRSIFGLIRRSAP